MVVTDTMKWLLNCAGSTAPHLDLGPLLDTIALSAGSAPPLSVRDARRGDQEWELTVAKCIGLNQPGRK